MYVESSKQIQCTYIRSSFYPACQFSHKVLFSIPWELLRNTERYKVDKLSQPQVQKLSSHC